MQPASPKPPDAYLMTSNKAGFLGAGAHNITANRVIETASNKMVRATWFFIGERYRFLANLLTSLHR